MNRTSQWNYDVKNKIYQALEPTRLQPLNTEGMIIKEIIKNDNKIVIDQNGIRRYKENNEMRVSCDGKTISFKKNETEKVYKLEDLP